MEDVIARMQDEKNGIPIRTVKSFLSKIPSVFSGNSHTSVLYTLLALRKQDSAGASAPQQAWRPAQWKLSQNSVVQRQHQSPLSADLCW